MNNTKAGLLAASLAPFWLFAAASRALADGDPIATDRPDFVESADVVGRGAFQIETSVALERNRSDGTASRTWTTPTLLRFGTSENLELRLETDGFTRERLDDGTAVTTNEGFANSSFGVKWRMREGDEKAGTATLAMLAHLEANSGSAAFRGSGVVPSLRVVSEWELPSEAAFGVMPGIAWQKDEAGARYWAPLLAATYSRPLGSSLRGFVELAGRELRSKRHGGNQVTLDAGVTYAVNRDTQLDTAINIGVNRFTPDVLITVGFSRRFR